MKNDPGLLEAMKASVVALDDWLNTYAADCCDPTRVAIARENISLAGGTIAYIADVQEKNRRAIAKAEGRE